MTELVRTPVTPAQRTAKIASEILSPYTVLIALPIAIAWHATRHILSAVGWGLLISVCVSFAPLGAIAYGAKKGLWDGHFVRNREARLIPLLICLVGVGLALAIVVAGHAPWVLIALVMSLLVIQLPCLLITQWWKISLHAAASAGAVVAVNIVYGPVTLVLWPLAALIGWSRVVLRDHSPAQVVAGVLLGGVLGGAVFAALI